jgi:peptide/nickel transport system substrate-binding protein
VPDFIFGASPNLPLPPFDPARAEALLRESGWHNRFAITLATSNDRYPKDTQVAQAVAQMLTRVGIKTSVEAMPISLLFSRGSKLEFSMLIAGTRADSGEGGMMLVQLLATHDAARGMGGVNRGRYSNPKLDAILATALATMDDRKRAALIAEAMEIGMRDVGLLSLYVMTNSWAARKGIVVTPRADELTIATSMRPQ